MPTTTGDTLFGFLAAYHAGEADCLPYLADYLEDQSDPRAAAVRDLIRWHSLAKANAGAGDDTDIWSASSRLRASAGVEGCRLCARWMPLHDGRRVVDLLCDARSVAALAVAELCWCGLATQAETRDLATEGHAVANELWAKCREADAAAYAAAYAADAADADAAYAAAYAADAAAYAAAAADAAAADAAAWRKARIWVVSLAALCAKQPDNSKGGAA